MWRFYIITDLCVSIWTAVDLYTVKLTCFMQGYSDSYIYFSVALG